MLILFIYDELFVCINIIVFFIGCLPALRDHGPPERDWQGHLHLSPAPGPCQATQKATQGSQELQRLHCNVERSHYNYSDSEVIYMQYITSILCLYYYNKTYILISKYCFQI